jgi:hypothetical protein
LDATDTEAEGDRGIGHQYPDHGGNHHHQGLIVAEQSTGARELPG